MRTYPTQTHSTRLFALSLLALALWFVNSSKAHADEEELPGRVVIDVDSPERALYRIAVPSLFGGSGDLGASGGEVLRNDFRLSSLFQVLDPRSFIEKPAAGMSLDKNAWSSVGAQGIVKGQITQAGSAITVEMRLYELARGETPVLAKTYRGDTSQLRAFMHDFANEVLRVLTGKAGAFGTHLVFARKVGPARKDIYVADFDGNHLFRASSGKGNAMLPAFGHTGGVWFSKLTDTGAFVTNTKSREKPVISSKIGMNMGPTLCNGRVYFSSTRDGNSEVYSSALDGTDQRRLTRDPGIDVSPSCGPGGKIAFVSSRHGGPQIFVMDADGGNPKRVTYRGNHNQTPSFCPDPKNPVIAFTARDGGGFDIVTVNLNTGEYKRLTQGQGINQDPTFSPDCRMIAFASSRGGIFIMSPDGLNQTKVLSGPLSTVRWGK
jgi:TolB protein